MFPQVPDGDVDLESFDDYSCAAKPRHNAIKMAPFQLLDDLPLDCSTPKTKLVAGSSPTAEDLTDVSTEGQQKKGIRKKEQKNVLGPEISGWKKQLNQMLEC